MGFLMKKIREIEGLNAYFESEFGDLPAAVMDAKPGSKSWSANECLDHLIQSNSRYFPVFEAASQGKLPVPGWARIPFFPRLWGFLLLRSVSPDNPKKTKTFRVFRPSQSSYGRNMAQDMVAANRELVKRIKTLGAVDLDKCMVRSPVSGWVVYSMRDCIRILAAHESRHFNQAKAAKSMALENRRA